MITFLFHKDLSQCGVKNSMKGDAGIDFPRRILMKDSTKPAAMAGRPSFWRDRRLAGLSGSCSQPCSKEMACWGAGLASPSGVRAVGPGEQLATPLCRWGWWEEPEARPECRRSFCFIPNPPLTQHRLLADTLPQVCGTCCWERGARGQIRELMSLFRISQKGRPRE